MPLSPSQNSNSSSSLSFIPLLHPPLFERTVKDLREKNYSEALNNLLLLCSNELNLEEVQLFYVCLNELLPHLNENEFRRFQQEALQSILNLSPNLHELQKKFAFNLAAWHLKRAEAAPLGSLRPYLDAMLFFSKGLKIAKEHGLVDLENLHGLASQIFMHLINRFIVCSKRIEMKLEDAIGKAAPGKLLFEQSLEEIEILATYMGVDKDYATIETLYRQARDVFLKITPSSKSLFESFSERITKGLSISWFFPLCSPTTLKYHTHLQEFRLEFENLKKANIDNWDCHAVLKAQKQVSKKFKEFFHILIQDAFTILGEPPCTYDFRAMGSIGRGEPCPYSDLEWMILIKNNECIPYFKTLAEFVELQIASLGESALAHFPVFTSLGPQNRSGLHVDSGGNPALHITLIGSPQTLANLQKPTSGTYDPTEITHCLLKSKSLKRNSPDLFKEYREACEAILNAPFFGDLAITVRKKQALDLIQKRVQDFNTIWKAPFEALAVTNLKTDYVELLNYLLCDLGLYYGVKKCNTLTLLNQLADLSGTPISKESCLLLKQAVATLYLIRIRLHCDYGEQKEEGSLAAHENRFKPFKPKEKEQLAEIYWLVLKPLYEQVKKALDERRDLSSLKIFITINAPDRQGKTPLHRAVIKNELGGIICLLRRGAQVMALTANEEVIGSQNILHLAAEHGNLAVLKYCWEYIQHVHGKETLDSMLHQKDQDGRLPIHEATRLSPKESIVKLFLDYGVDPNVENKFQFRPLHWAAMYGNFESAKLLLERGAETACVNFKGLTPLDLALLKGQDRLAMLFILPGKELVQDLIPEGIENREDFYTQELEKAHREENREKELFLLQKLSSIYLENKEMIRAAHLSNAAYLIAEQFGFNDFLPLVLCQLERIEGEFLYEQWKVKTASDFREYLASQRAYLKCIRENALQQFEGKVSSTRIQKSVTNQFKDLLCNIIYKAIDSLNESPPTAFAVFGLGSMATDEMCVRSDLKFGFLIQEGTPEARSYFKKLSEFVSLKILNLGETEHPFLAGRSLVVKGFCLNPNGLTPNGKEGIFSLIGTVEDLVEYQSEKWALEHPKETFVADQLASICRLMGDADLMKAYAENLHRSLNVREGGGYFTPKLYKVRALKLLRQFMTAINTDVNTFKSEQRSIQIRNHLHQNFKLLINGLKLYYQIKKNILCEILIQLKNKNKLNYSDYLCLAYLFEKIQRLRLHSDFSESPWDGEIDQAILECYDTLLLLRQRTQMFLDGNEEAFIKLNSGPARN